MKTQLFLYTDENTSSMSDRHLKSTRHGISKVYNFCIMMSFLFKQDKQAGQNTGSNLITPLKSGTITNMEDYSDSMSDTALEANVRNNTTDWNCGRVLEEMWLYLNVNLKNNMKYWQNFIFRIHVYSQTFCLEVMLSVTKRMDNSSTYRLILCTYVRDWNTATIWTFVSLRFFFVFRFLSRTWLCTRFTQLSFLQTDTSRLHSIICIIISLYISNKS